MIKKYLVTSKRGDNKKSKIIILDMRAMLHDILMRKKKQ